jgi:hypothetical protein
MCSAIHWSIVPLPLVARHIGHFDAILVHSCSFKEHLGEFLDERIWPEPAAGGLSSNGLKQSDQISTRNYLVM